MMELVKIRKPSRETGEGLEPVGGTGGASHLVDAGSCGALRRSGGCWEPVDRSCSASETLREDVKATGWWSF